jgi:putative endonuclease
VSPEASAKGDKVIMWYVYIIRSISNPDRRYIGMTNCIEKRLAEHNAGKGNHTRDGIPWVLETVVGLSSREKAAAFEKYLKTGSGFAFAKKHF